MAKIDDSGTVKFRGVIIEVLADDHFKVETDSGMEITATSAVKTAVDVGQSVRVEIQNYDFTRGVITSRYK